MSKLISSVAPPSVASPSVGEVYHYHRHQHAHHVVEARQLVESEPHDTWPLFNHRPHGPDFVFEAHGRRGVPSATERDAAYVQGKTAIKRRPVG
jgi:hypothetical protein